jgi:hypothetical protein
MTWAIKRGRLHCCRHYGTKVHHVCFLSPSHSVMCAQEMDRSSLYATSPQVRLVLKRNSSQAEQHHWKDSPRKSNVLLLKYNCFPRVLSPQPTDRNTTMRRRRNAGGESRGETLNAQARQNQSRR